MVNVTTKFEGIPLSGGVKLGGTVFDFALLYLGNGGIYKMFKIQAVV